MIYDAPIRRFIYLFRVAFFIGMVFFLTQQFFIFSHEENCEMYKVNI